jgi:hypothetical protein
VPTTLLAVTPATVGAEEILLTAGLIAVAMLAAVTSYRGMQRPRLVLTEVEEGAQFRAARGDVIRYAVAAPFLILGWNLLLLVILIVAANSLTGDSIVVVSSAIVLAARAFAHISPERSHELAKTVPLTLVTLVLISGGLRDQASLEAIADELGNLTITPQATLLLLVAEYVFTAAWYWIGVRWLWPRGRDVPGLPRHSVRDDHLRRSDDARDTFTFDSHRS